MSSASGDLKRLSNLKGPNAIEKHGENLAELEFSGITDII